MFDNLIESKAAKQRRAGGALLSAAVHAMLITGAVIGTLHASQELSKPKEEEVKFVKVQKDEPPPPKEEPKPPPPDITVKPPTAKGFQVLTAPIKIPDVLPDIDLSKKVTNEADFSGKGVAGGLSTGVVGGTVQKFDENQTFYDFQVEQQVVPAPGNPRPHYPDMLRSANVEGEVLAQFTVDTTGRADMSTFRVIKSTHDLFTSAVKATLPSMKFFPAQVGGRKVRQLVQMPFQFSLNK